MSATILRIRPLCANVFISEDKIIIRIYNIPLSRIKKLQEKINAIGATSALMSNASRGHFLELTANSRLNYPMRRCVCQPATQMAHALYTFCENTLEIPQHRVGITTF